MTSSPPSHNIPLLETQSFVVPMVVASLQHIELNLQQTWEPQKIVFPATEYYVKEEMESQNISSISMNFRLSLEDQGDTPVVDEEDVIFNT